MRGQERPRDRRDARDRRDDRTPLTRERGLEKLEGLEGLEEMSRFRLEMLWVRDGTHGAIIEGGGGGCRDALT